VKLRKDQVGCKDGDAAGEGGKSHHAVALASLACCISVFATYLIFSQFHSRDRSTAMDISEVAQKPYLSQNPPKCAIV